MTRYMSCTLTGFSCDSSAHREFTMRSEMGCQPPPDLPPLGASLLHRPFVSPSGDDRGVLYSTLPVITLCLRKILSARKS